jgi:hypothetical protein
MKALLLASALALALTSPVLAHGGARGGGGGHMGGFHGGGFHGGFGRGGGFHNRGFRGGRGFFNGGVWYDGCPWWAEVQGLCY